MTKKDSAHSRDHVIDGSDAGAVPDVVSLSDLLDRRVPLEWHESVAIVAGLSAALVERHATGMPSPRDITLSPQGTIAINGPAAHEFIAIPRLLHELLSVTTPPTPLRLLVLHTISSDVDKSPTAFGAALAYYERPGRETWIQSARQRCLDTPIPDDAPGRPTLSELFETKKATGPKKEAGAKKAPEKPRRGRVVAVLAAGAGVAALALAVSYRSGNPTVVNGVTAARSMAAHVTATGRGFAEAVAGTLIGDGVSHATATADTTQPDAKHPRLAKPQHAALDVPSAGAGRSDGPADVAPETASADSTDPDDAAPRTIAELTPVVEAAPTETVARQDIPSGVVPPRLLEPVRLPSWAQEGITESPNVIQLDIADDGTVERVRLISPTMRLTDMMILSAAKTWIFEPASEGGRPVPYRMTLNWVPTAR